MRLHSSFLRKAALIWIGATALLGLNAASAENPAESPALSVLLYGDSLAAGYGLERKEALEGQLESALRKEGLQAQVINGGVSGDTTAGGLARVGWTPSDDVDLVVIILGGNDAMRGLTPEQSEANLDGLLEDFGKRGVKVLLTGMRAPPNLGPEYAARFEPMYERLAAKHNIALYPFILEGVAGDLSLNQRDGIHPNTEGVKIMVAGLLPMITQLLSS